MQSVIKFVKDHSLIIFLVLFISMIGYSFSPQYQRNVAYHAHSILLTQQQHALADTSDMINFASNGLTQLLDHTPTAARDSVQIIQTNLNSIPPILRFSTVAFIVRPGHNPPVVANALPIFQWRDYLNNMMQNKCTYIDSDKLTDPNAKARMSSYAFGSIACPIMTPTHEVIGIVGMSFDKQEDVPCQHNCPVGTLTMDDVMNTNLKVASQFGAYFSTRGYQE